MISRPEASSGFTLIELTVVLAVMGLVMGLVMARSSWHSRSLDIGAASVEIAQALREARSMSIGSDRPVEFALDLDEHSFRIGQKPRRVLPKQFSLAILTTDGEARNGASPAIRFDPDGGSTGGRITLSDGNRKVEIGVDWLTGRVRIADAQ